MNEYGFDGWTRRRFGMSIGVAALLVAAAGETEARKRKRRKRKAGRQGDDRCRECLVAPFTVTATWPDDKDHDTYLFVPPRDDASGPSRYTDYTCRPDNSLCASVHPFTCFTALTTPKGELTTVSQLFAGTYEYWIELDDGAPAAGEVTIVARNGDGHVLGQWSSPAGQAAQRIGWHVFDIDGGSGRITSVDTVVAARLPAAAHDPATKVCVR
jgi:hypothetical protein